MGWSRQCPRPIIYIGAEKPPGRTTSCSWMPPPQPTTGNRVLAAVKRRRTRATSPHVHLCRRRIPPLSPLLESMVIGPRSPSPWANAAAQGKNHEHTAKQCCSHAGHRSPNVGCGARSSPHSRRQFRCRANHLQRSRCGGGRTAEAACGVEQQPQETDATHRRPLT